MRTNRLRQALADKRVLVGALVNMPSPSLIELCGYLGYDWVMLDGEHEPLDVATCEEMCRAGDAANVAVIARVAANRPDLISTFADTGADAVLVPHVADPAAAANVVSAIRFPPAGHRGLHGGTRAARFGVGLDAGAYFANTDSGTMAAAMIEDAAALDHLDEIANTDGLDVFFVGPSDLSGSLGYPGQIDHPEVKKTLRRTIEALSAPSKNAVAFLAHNAEQVAAAIEMGVRMPHTSTTRQVAATLRGYLTEASTAAR